MPPPGVDREGNGHEAETAASHRQGVATSHGPGGASSERTTSNARQGIEPLVASLDEPAAGKRSWVSIPGGLTYLFLVASGTGLAAFGLNLGLARRRSPDAFSVMPAGEEPPVRVGLRALTWGTVWAFAGTGLVVAVAGTIFHLCGMKLVRFCKFTRLYI